MGGCQSLDFICCCIWVSGVANGHHAVGCLSVARSAACFARVEGLAFESGSGGARALNSRVGSGAGRYPEKCLRAGGGLAWTTLPSISSCR